ncbi:MAG: iron ABC transporter permease [Caldiserica bacterium]|nr:iron ABC transporter permease [Caldisericota bacterium]MDH7562696.1 iron ABC transporter permease [Caldisericota bacterium]
MKYFLVILFLVLFLFWGLFAGGAPLSFEDVVEALGGPLGLSYPPPLHQSIIWNFRIPRMLTAFLTGSALALAGCISQSLFRNPLADPFIVGTSAGANFGVTISYLFNILYFAPGFLATPLFAFFGALLVTFTVLLLGRKGGTLPVNTLLLAGVAANYFFVSLSSLFAVLGRNVLHRSVLWSLEGFAGANWDSFFSVLPLVLIGLLALIFLSKPLDLVLLGDEAAIGLGLNVGKLKFFLTVVVGLLTGAAVSVSGLIGFVGLVVPHIGRMIVGAKHSRLLPFSFLTGGVLLLGADNLARSIIPGFEVPVAVITALMGVPFFIYLLRRT